MKKKFVLCLVFVIISTLTSYSQQNPPIKLKSDIYRVLTRPTDKDEWKSADFSAHQIIVYDKVEKTIKIYADDDPTVYDVLTVVTNKKDESFTFKCLDKNSEVCTIDFVFLDKKPLYFMVKYPLHQVMLFISQAP